MTSKEVKYYEVMMFEKLCKGEAHCFAIVMAKENLSFEVEKIEDDKSSLL